MAISTRDELIKTLHATPVVLRALIRGLGVDQLRRQPEPGEWSPAEVISHLADTEERALGRTRRMLAEDDPELPGYDQEALAIERGYTKRDPMAELDRYDGLRTEHLGLLESLDEAGWRRTGRHSEHGRISIELYVSHVAGDDVGHLAQIARAL